MKKYINIFVTIIIGLSLASCDFGGGEEPSKPSTPSTPSTPSNPGSSGTQDPSGSDSKLPSNPNIFTANGTPYYYGHYSPQGGWSIGTYTTNGDYRYYIFDVDAYSVQLSPEQLKEYNAGTLYNVNSVRLRIAIEEFNPEMDNVGKQLKLRIVDDEYEESSLSSRFYFFYNNSKTQIRYTFTDTLQGEITFLDYDNKIITLNLKNVHVKRTGTAPEDAPIEFVLNGRISFLRK